MNTRVRAQIGFELRAVLRNGEQLMVTLLLPALALFLLGGTKMVSLPETEFARINYVTPGVLTFALVAAAFTSPAIATSFDRRGGVLRLLATTPLGPGGLLAAKAVAVAAVHCLQFLVLATVAFALGWRPEFTWLLASLPLVALGLIAFTALALLLASTLRFEAVLALANVILIALVAGGGVMIATAALPGMLGPLASALPSGALGDGLRTSLNGENWPFSALITLTVWAVISAWAVKRWFRWAH